MTLAVDDIAAARPQGRARRWTDEEKAALALLLLSDATLSVFLWDELAPKPYRGLLEAEAIEDVRAPGVVLPPVWFDVKTQRYGLGKRGFIGTRFTSATADRGIRVAVEAVRTGAMDRAEASVTAVYAGTLGISEWQTQFASDLKVLALTVAAAGVGGVGRLGAEDLTVTSTALLFHLTRLIGFATDISAGIAPERAAARARMYPDSIVTGGYEGGRERAHITAGFLTYENILDPEADHCEPDPRNPAIPDCPGVTRRGPQPIGTLPPVGQRRCLWNCRCRWKFSRDGVEV